MTTRFFESLSEAELLEIYRSPWMHGVLRAKFYIDQTPETCRAVWLELTMFERVKLLMALISMHPNHSLGGDDKKNKNKRILAEMFDELNEAVLQALFHSFNPHEFATLHHVLTPEQLLKLFKVLDEYNRIILFSALPPEQRPKLFHAECAETWFDKVCASLMDVDKLVGVFGKMLSYLDKPEKARKMFFSLPSDMQTRVYYALPAHWRLFVFLNMNPAQQVEMYKTPAENFDIASVIREMIDKIEPVFYPELKVLIKPFRAYLSRITGDEKVWDPTSAEPAAVDV